jgi:carbon-monoxide dehydrogenase large subunit
MTTTLPTRTDLFADGEIRVEGRDKVSGRMQYTADIQKPNSLWAAFTTSPYAYARIVKIDTTQAKAVPGVRAVLTADDIGHRLWGRNMYDWPVLAWDVVRLIGDRVAAVAADTREAAEEAARLVEVTYEELEPVLDPDAALPRGAPVLHPDRPSYFHAARAGKEPMKVPHPNVQGINRMAKGEKDLEPIFASAHRVYEHVFHTPRLHAGYIEPHATMVWIDEEASSGSGQALVHVQSPNKAPLNLRTQLARTLEIPANTVVIEPSAIGGDFGGKGMTIDEPPLYFLAKATGRPVRYVWTYTEELTNNCTRHSATITLRTAVDAHGKLLAHHSKVVYDGGAFGGGKPGGQVLPGSGYGTVAYNCPNAFVESMAVYTNTVPGAHVRAPNDVQVFFAWEQHVDMIARDLGIDPVEFRILNVIRPGETSLTGEGVRQPRAVEVLERLRQELAAAPKLPAGRGRGIALACRHTGANKTELKARLHADGSIHLLCGTPDQGGGQHTVAQRIMAKTLGVDLSRVTIRRGSTAEAPLDPGTGGARVTNSLGGASLAAAEALRTELEKRSGLQLRDGRFIGSGSGESFDAVAARLCADGPIEVTGTYEPHTGDHHEGDFTFSAYALDVDVDRETGTTSITDVLIVLEVGQIINPIAHDGQIEGGFIYGLGTSMMEELVLDESGKVTNPSLGDYKIPTIMDIPPLRMVVIPGSLGEGAYGVKAAGEVSNTAVAPAIANALHDAVGIRLTEFPLTSERVYTALHGG